MLSWEGAGPAVEIPPPVLVTTPVGHVRVEALYFNTHLSVTY
jgi:hypothetical protein